MADQNYESCITACEACAEACDTCANQCQGQPGMEQCEKCYGGKNENHANDW